MPERHLSGLGISGGEVPADAVMLEAVRRFDWSATPAGDMAQWADALKHVTRLAMLSPTATAVLVGKDGLVVFNDAMRALLGAHYDGAIGQPVETVFPDAAGYFRRVLERSFAGNASRLVDRRVEVYRDGEPVSAWIRVSFTPIADAEGNVSGVFAVAGETTARVTALRELKRSEERIEIALDAGGIIGTWDIDAETNTLTCDARFARLFGVTAQDGRTGIDNELLVNFVHPDDRELVRSALERSMRTGADYKCRYRIITAAGEMRWYFDAGRAVRDEHGKVAKLSGVVVDLTSRVAAEDALADSEKRFRALVESIPQIVWSTDAEGAHDYFNARWNEFTGLDAASVDGATWETLVHPDDWSRVSSYWGACVATGSPYDIEYRFLHHSGQFRWLRVMALPVRGVDGEVVRWYGTSTDIEESKTLELERKLVANELDHRIKNLFALVNGLIALSGREDASFAPFADQVARRLSALHKAHEFIHRSDDSPEKPKSIQGLAGAILAPYDDGARITIQGDDPQLRANMVTPLALVFHELATNSTKYGAMAGEDGSLSLHFRLSGGRIVLTWLEDGFTPSGPSSGGGGFGSKLLSLIIERQLRGTYQRTLAPTRLVFEMDIPA